MPSACCRGVASETWGSPSAFFFRVMRCGARITHPVWPLHPPASRRASFSGRNGSPALPKMLSTKSRFETSTPGAKNRISIDWCLTTPATSGQTMGRSNSETNVRARSAASKWDVYGSVSRSSGGVRAAFRSPAKTRLGTDFLSAGMGSPPSTM